MQLHGLQEERAVINPDKKWLETNRTFLMSEITRARYNEPAKAFSVSYIWDGLSVVLPPKFVHSFMRPVLVAVLVFMVASGGWITTVSASNSSLPGQRLHVIKTSLESAQIAVAHLSGSSETVAKLEAERAVKRIEEARTLARTPAYNPAQKKEQKVNVQRAVVDAQKSMNNLNKELVKAEAQKPAAAASLVAVTTPAVEHVEDALEKAKSDIKEVVLAVAIPAEGDGTDDDSVENDFVGVVAALERDVIAVQTKNADLMVKKYTEDQQMVSAEAVKQHLDDQIEKIENKIDGSSLLVTKKVEQVKKATKGDAAETVEKIVKKTAVATESIHETSVMAKETLTEAQAFIKQDDFGAAAQKVAEARELASTAAQTASDVAVVAKTVENENELDAAVPVPVVTPLPAVQTAVQTPQQETTPAPVSESAGL